MDWQTFPTTIPNTQDDTESRLTELAALSLVLNPRRGDRFPNWLNSLVGRRLAGILRAPRVGWWQEPTFVLPSQVDHA